MKRNKPKKGGGLVMTFRMRPVEPVVPREMVAFREPFTLAMLWDLTAEEALDEFKKEGLKVTFDYDEMLAEEHSMAFTIAKMLDLDLLATVKDMIEEAIEDGMSMNEFRALLTPVLTERGWWGEKMMYHPNEKRMVMTNNGSAYRLNQIFRTNMQSAYSAGQWEQMQRQVDIAPYLLYDAVDDHRVRPEHAQWDGKVLPMDSPFWDAHYPPNGWNCRCGVLQVDEVELEEMGLSVSGEPVVKTEPYTHPESGKTIDVPEGLHPSWVGNVGKERMKRLEEALEEKESKYYIT